jgi:protoporphyrinogen/coproporphyrinogen III oxidase
MIGSLSPNSREVVVVGAGIAGMLAAYQLQKKGYEVTLYEAKPEAGGLIKTKRTEWGICESAAHSFLATPLVQEFCRELGVGLTGVRPDARARFVLRGGKFRKFPLTPGEVATAFARAYFVLADSKRSPEDLSMEAWGRRYLGQAAVDYGLNPFLRGIYGARPSELAVGAAFPALIVPRGQSLLSAQLAKKFRKPTCVAPVVKSRPRPMMVPQNGMGDLTHKLEEVLLKKLGSRFKRGIALHELPLVQNVVLSVPADVAAGLIAKEDQTLSLALRDVPYTSLVSVSVFVKKQYVPPSIRGVGVLIPECEERKCLGILFTSSSFEGRAFDESRYVSFTVMMGGSGRPELVQAPEDEIRRIVQEEMRALLGLTGDPEHQEIFRWNRAIPQYGQGLLNAWAAARTGWCSKPGHIHG